MVYGSAVYGEGVYGESVAPVPPTPHDSSCQICGEGWRIEATNLVTGVVKAVLHPISMEWDDQFSKVGTGSIVVATEDPSADDIWPHTTGIVISRVLPSGARVGHFVGYVEKFSAESGGNTTIGLQPIDEFLNHRLLADENGGISYSTPDYVSPTSPGPGLQQTQIAADLVEIAITGRGKVPLNPVAGFSSQLRVARWNSWEFKNIGEMIAELTGLINGVEYRLSHQFYESPARWVTTMTFSDPQDIDRGLVIRDEYEAWRYGLDTDAKNQASRVYGVGTGEGAAQMFSVAYDVDAEGPEFQSTVAWKDVAVPATLDEYTRGAVSDNRDPITVPSMTLVGLTDVPPDQIAPGDIITPAIGYGAATFRGEKARVTAIAWSVSVGSPVTRTLALVPLIRPSFSVKTQIPAKAPVKEVETPEQGNNPPPVTPIAPPTPPNLPSAVINLLNWKLTLATGSEGNPDEITQPRLQTYKHPQFFTTVPGPWVKFRVPQNGVTTPNSKNTRTELREMRNRGQDKASWSNKTGVHTLEGVLRFMELPPSKPHVVAMQVHSPDDDVTVLRLEGSDLWTTNGDNTHGKKIMSGYRLGTEIAVKLVGNSSGFHWYLNGVHVSSVSTTGSGMYFKAGAYQQAGNSGSGFGEVHYKTLKVIHA